MSHCINVSSRKEPYIYASFPKEIYAIFSSLAVLATQYNPQSCMRCAAVYVRCSVLQCIAVWCSVLQMWCSLMQPDATWCKMRGLTWSYSIFGINLILWFDLKLWRYTRTHIIASLSLVCMHRSCCLLTHATYRVVKTQRMSCLVGLCAPNRHSYGNSIAKRDVLVLWSVLCHVTSCVMKLVSSSLVSWSVK